jgi:hypothetical protein
VSREPVELFHAHLDVLVHLMRDDLRWRESHSPRGRESSVLSLLHQQRRHLLSQQGGDLAREARFRVMGDRLVARLEEELGVEPRDAVAIAWFFRTEVRNRMEVLPRETRQGGDAAAGGSRRRRSGDEVESGGTAGYEGEGELESLLDEVGAAHARLLDGADPFLSRPGSGGKKRGFPMAVAVAATRVARRAHGQTTWMEVEALARRILELVLGRKPERLVL